jgi:hypothetical protein
MRNVSRIISSAGKTSVYAGQCRCWNGFTELGLPVLQLRLAVGGWRLGVGRSVGVGGGNMMITDSTRCDRNELNIGHGDVPHQICGFFTDFATKHKYDQAVENL